jgi:hypothetical protein
MTQRKITRFHPHYETSNGKLYVRPNIDIDMINTDFQFVSSSYKYMQRLQTRCVAVVSVNNKTM